MFVLQFLSAHRRFIAAAAGLISFLMLSQATHAQSTRLTEEERNTVEIVRQAGRGVVHVNVRATKDRRFGKVDVESGAGTGFVIDHEGHILTAYHVIENATEVEVALSTGRRLSAQLVGTAPQLDIALLKVDASAEELVPLTLGDSMSLQVGQKVIAIGNPLGLHNTVTVGIVSALDRSVDGAPAVLQEALIQTDAAINPGSSGGPLLNSMGQVVGINNAKIGNAQGLSFAIPIDFAREIVPDLIEMGHPYIPELGFHGSDITPDFAKLFGLPLDGGVLVEEVEPNSPSARVGLRAGDRIVPVGDRLVTLGGDVITAVNGQSVGSVAEIAHILLGTRPGETLRLTVYRIGQTLEISIPLQKMRMISS
jgi:S1-C subfamily serine protease